MTINRELIIISCIMIIGISVVNAVAIDHYEGEAYLQTVDEIESWNRINGVVSTGLQWFDELAEQWTISDLRIVDISCQSELNFYHIVFDDGNTVNDVCSDFNQQNEIIHAWPVIIPEWYSIPNDTYYSNQWGMTLINAPLAWDYETGNSSVIIGISDTGADVYDTENQQATVHPDLLGNLWNENGLYGINVIDPGQRPDDGFGHGTHVAGIAGAVTNNTIGVSGVAGGGFGNGEGISLLIIRSLDDLAGSNEEYLAESICQALNPDGNWSTDDEVDIINMSWGMRRALTDTVPSCNGAFNVLRTAIVAAVDRGVVLIAAAGNIPFDFSSLTCEYWPYPAGYDEVIAVASVNPDDEHVPYSVRGPFVELAAPGGVGAEITDVTGGHGIEYDTDDIFSTFPRDSFTLQDLDFWSIQTGYNIVETNVTNDYGYSTGTSMAAPYVSGLAGLVLSRFPSYDAQDVRNLLKNSSEKVDANSNSYDENGWNEYLGYGRINAGWAIAPPSAPTGLSISGSVGQHPTITWNTNPESDIQAYKVYRKRHGIDNDYVFRATVNAPDTSYTDNGITIYTGRFSAYVYYKIKAEDVSNQLSDLSDEWVRTKYRNQVEQKILSDIQIPSVYALHTAYPNPFNPSTSIRFDLPERSRVTMVIYDVLGREITTLIRNTIEPGFHEILWDGKDNSGNPVSTGMYIYQFSAFSEESKTQFVQSYKMVMMK